MLNIANWQRDGVNVKGGNFQKNAVDQGRWWEDTCVRALGLAGFQIADRHYTPPEVGVEIDIIANSEQGIAFYVDCKGSLKGTRPGLLRTDSIMKSGFVLAALYRYGYTPLLCMPSHLPTRGHGVAQHRVAHELARFEDINPLLVADMHRLEWLASAPEAELIPIFGPPTRG